MAEDPLDQLMSATLAIEGEEAKHHRPALPFAGTPIQQAQAAQAQQAEQARAAQARAAQARAAQAQEAQQLQPGPGNQAGSQAPRWPAPPPAYASGVGMPTAMPEMLARFPGGGATAPAPPPRISDQALARGATASAYALSNAATAPNEEPQAREPAPAPRPAAVYERERIDYLWHDKHAEENIVRAPSMKRAAQLGGIEDEWLPEHVVSASSREAATVRAILVERKPTSLEEVCRLYEESLDRGGERLFCLVRGELALSFEPVEALRVTLSVVTPFLTDGRMKEAYDAAREALDTSTGLAPAIAAMHKDRVEEAMKAALRTSYATIEAVIERALIEDRSFSRRKVFGESFLRGLLYPLGRATSATPGAVPVYVPDDGAQALPLMSRVPMRLIVEVRPTQDAVESHPLALRVVALGRVVELTSRAR